MSAELATSGPGVTPQRAVGRLIKQVFSSLLRGVDQRMQPLELTAMQWEPLLLLFLNRADTVAALARESNVNCSAMTRMLDRLEDKRLLKRKRSDEDRRVVHLALTEKGLAIGNEIQPLLNAELERHLRGLSDEEIATLINLLTRMLKNGRSET